MFQGGTNPGRGGAGPPGEKSLFGGAQYVSSRFGNSCYIPGACNSEVAPDF